MSSDAAGERFRQLRRLLEPALELAPDARQALIASTGSADPALAAELAALLAADAGPGGLLDRSLGATAADLLATPTGDPPPGTRLGAYRVVGPLGAGGMGTVVLAERADGAYEQRVAIKLFRAASELVPRFERERRILARLEHPAIARLLDAGVAPDGRPYCVLELVDGRPLTEFAAARRLSFGERAALLSAIADAVAFAHRNLVVHRDLKPANVLVNADGQPKLLDFGIAALLQDDVASTGTLRGLLTPAYAAPEQLRGEPITTATDVWALGALLYELLAGRRPFADAGGRLALEHAILTAEPARLRASDRAVPADLEAIARRAMAKTPAERYPSADAMADDLRRFAAGLPVAARGGSRRYVLTRFVRRHRAAVAGALAGVALLAASLGAALWQARAARQAGAAARLDAERATLARDFLVRLFETTNPAADEALDRLSARDMLDRASARLLDGELAASPIVEADLLDSIGFLRGQRGELAPAVELLRAALAAKRQAYPAGHPEILYTQAVLANTLVTLGRLDAATAECATLLPAVASAQTSAAAAGAAVETSAAPAATPQNRAMASRACARLAAARGRYGEAIALGERAAAAAQDGQDQGFRALVAADLAAARLLDGDAEGAAAAVRDSELLLAAAPDASRAASVAANAGWVATERGDLAAAEARLREATSAAVTVFGAEHRITLPLRRRLATVLARSGRAVAACTELTAVLAAAERLLGADDRETALARAALGEAELAARRPGAEATLAQALGELQRLLPANHLEIARTRVQLARDAAARSNTVAARTWLEAAATNLPARHPFRTEILALRQTLLAP